MFKAVGNYVWGPSPDGTDSVVAVTMGNVSAESIAEGLNLLREKEILESREQTQREMDEAVERVNHYIIYGEQLHKIIHGQPQEVS